MHVAIDGVGNHVGGGWSVLRRTVAEIAADPRITQVTVFSSPLDLCASRPSDHAKVTWVEHPREHKHRTARFAWLSVGFDAEVDRVRADVALSMNGVGRTAVPRVCLVQQAFTVWGNLRSIRPKRFATKIALLRRETKRSAKKAEAVVVQTSWMRERVRDEFGLDAEVLPLGLPRPQVDFSDHGHSSVLSFPSTLPYKNAKLIVDAVRAVPRLRHVLIDDASPDDVLAALRQATAVVVASEVESFGLPIVEGFATGCAVVATDRGWSRSVGGSGPRYFAHGSTKGLVTAVTDVFSSPDRVAELRERGREQLDELWGTAPYEGLVDVLERVCGS